MVDRVPELRRQIDVILRRMESERRAGRIDMPHTSLHTSIPRHKSFSLEPSPAQRVGPQIDLNSEPGQQ